MPIKNSRHETRTICTIVSFMSFTLIDSIASPRPSNYRFELISVCYRSKTSDNNFLSFIGLFLSLIIDKELQIKKKQATMSRNSIKTRFSRETVFEHMRKFRYELNSGNHWSTNPFRTLIPSNCILSGFKYQSRPFLCDYYQSDTFISSHTRHFRNNLGLECYSIIFQVSIFNLAQREI